MHATLEFGFVPVVLDLIQPPIVRYHSAGTLGLESQRQPHPSRFRHFDDGASVTEHLLHFHVEFLMSDHENDVN
jgi:hypothetical protein